AALPVLACFEPPAQRAPFCDALFEPLRADTLSAQQLDRVERHHTIRAPTIRDDITALPELREALRQLRQWHGDGSRDMSRQVLLPWPDVDQRDATSVDSAQQLVAV